MSTASALRRSSSSRRNSQALQIGTTARAAFKNGDLKPLHLNQVYLEQTKSSNKEEAVKTNNKEDRNKHASKQTHKNSAMLSDIKNGPTKYRNGETVGVQLAKHYKVRFYLVFCSLGFVAYRFEPSNSVFKLATESFWQLQH
jgi:hypothetical protein